MKYLIFVAAIFISAYSSAQENIQGVAFYAKQTTFEFDNGESMNDFLSKKDKDSGFNSIKYKLTFAENESIFQLEDGLILDNADKRLARMFGGKGIYYMNANNKKIIRQVESFGELFLIDKTHNIIEWNLTNESKKIDDLLCYKATSVKIIDNDKIFKKEIIAWYCPEISIPFGPIGYGGVPGLIVELTIENEVSYSLINIKFDSKQINIEEPGKGVKVTEEEYNEIGKKMLKDLLKGRI